MNNTAVLAISTPDTEDNYYSQLMEMTLKDSDETIFRTIKIGLSCEQCVARKVAKCPHTASRLPPWKSDARQELTEHIMAGDPARMHRELHGMVGSKQQFVFKTFTRAFNGLAPYRWLRPPNVLHLAIDPSGGGASEYAYCLVGHEEGKDVIIGYYSIDTSDSNDIKSLFMALFKRLRHSRTYQDALVIVYVEANMSHFIPVDMERLFLSEGEIFGRVEFQRMKMKNNMIRPGVLTTHDDKEQFVNYVRLQLGAGNILFAEELLGLESRLAEHRRLLIDQLNNYRKDIKESLDPGFAEEKITYTGKSGGKRDDLCIALQLSLYHMQTKRHDEDFQERCRKNAWRL
jgi:hypothetical protein